MVVMVMKKPKTMLGLEVEGCLRSPRYRMWQWYDSYQNHSAFVELDGYLEPLKGAVVH